jgi:hypothetical protein
MAAAVWLVALVLSPSVTAALMSAGPDSCCRGNHSACCKRRGHAAGPQIVSNPCAGPRCGCSTIPSGAADSIAVRNGYTGAADTPAFREEIPSRVLPRVALDAAAFQRPPPSC